MNFTEIENYLTKQERTVTGVKFEQGTDPLLNTDLVDVPEYCSVEDIQELARDLVDEMYEQLSNYELRKD